MINEIGMTQCKRCKAYFGFRLVDDICSYCHKEIIHFKEQLLN
ncbi:MAG: hypothetical protein AABY22_31850 [Nanoarchaeota archaeon]